MELNQFEKQTQEQFRSREIQPSTEAWSQLDTMLSTVEIKPKVYKWQYCMLNIVAMFLLMIALFYWFDQSNTLKNQKQIANNYELRSILKKPHKEIFSLFNKNERTLGMIDNSIESEGYSKNKKLLNKKLQKKVFNLQKHSEKIQEVSCQNLKYEGDDFIVSKDDVLVNKEIVINTPQIIYKNKTKEIKTELKIDPNLLLDQVDGEIKLTFRQKMIKALSKNLKEAKESIASRNKE
ncbi:hypothetical protein [Flavobacterium oreochromis]|uniref:hypothetical protein n=1 Tax=Flavobacterium oreochromis TaxID=2906078 RepID=UPI00385938C0